MNHTITFSYHQMTLDAICYPADPDRRKGCIFYFHGGGLLFGSIRDLPSPYIRLFNQAGFDLISLSYPLAPESGICDILNACHAWIEEIVTHPKRYGYDSMPPYVLFGRSAGAFLALSTACRIQKEKKEGINMPSCILSFYGYHTFLLPEFLKPAPAYLKLPAVPEALVKQLIRKGPVTEGSMQTRYSLYIHARQQGNWTSFLGTSEEVAACSLSEEDLKTLSPCFFTASSGDQDVPFRESKSMASKVPGSIFKPVYYLEHDFDRDTHKKEGMQIYQEALGWMDPLVSAIVPAHSHK